MFDTKQTRDRIEAEKNLFDYARMYLTVVGMIGVCRIMFNVRDKVDPLTAVMYYPTLVALVAFTAYLGIRFYLLSDHLGDLLVKQSTNFVHKLISVLIAFGIFFVGFSTWATIGAALEGVK